MQDIPNKERQIGRHAAKLVTQYLRQNIGKTFTIRGKGGFDEGKKIHPMLQATKARAKMGEHRLLGIDATSNKPAFIHHYGKKSKRAATTVYFEDPRYKKKATRRRAHILRTPEKSIFKEIYQKSGAVAYLQAALSETRSEAFREQFNTQLQKSINHE